MRNALLLSAALLGGCGVAAPAISPSSATPPSSTAPAVALPAPDNGAASVYGGLLFPELGWAGQAPTSLSGCSSGYAGQCTAEAVTAAGQVDTILARLAEAGHPRGFETQATRMEADLAAYAAALREVPAAVDDRVKFDTLTQRVGGSHGPDRRRYGRIPLEVTWPGYTLPRSRAM